MEEETAKETTHLLSPKIDSVFQVLFGEVGSEFITKELLEAILGVNTNEIIERMLYYWGRAYIRNLKKGESYQNLERTIVILLLNGEIAKLKELDFISKYKLIETKERQDKDMKKFS